MTDENIKKMLENLADRVSSLENRQNSNNENMMKRVSELENRERTITKCIKDFNETQEKILRLLQGDEFSGTEGIKNRINEFEVNQKELQKFKQKSIYWLSGAAFMGSTLAGIIGFLIWNFVIKP